MGEKQSKYSPCPKGTQSLFPGPSHFGAFHIFEWQNKNGKFKPVEHHSYVFFT